MCSAPTGSPKAVPAPQARQERGPARHRPDCRPSTARWTHRFGRSGQRLHQSVCCPVATARAGTRPAAWAMCSPPETPALRGGSVAVRQPCGRRRRRGSARLAMSRSFAANGRHRPRCHPEPPAAGRFRGHARFAGSSPDRQGQGSPAPRPASAAASATMGCGPTPHRHPSAPAATPRRESGGGSARAGPRAGSATGSAAPQAPPATTVR